MILLTLVPVCFNFALAVTYSVCVIQVPTQLAHGLFGFPSLAASNSQTRCLICSPVSVEISSQMYSNKCHTHMCSEYASSLVVLQLNFLMNDTLRQLGPWSPYSVENTSVFRHPGTITFFFTGIRHF